MVNSGVESQPTAENLLPVLDSSYGMLITDVISETQNAMFFYLWVADL